MDSTQPIHNDTFDFDCWISDNGLTSLKNALIGLEFNNLHSVLSLTAPLMAFFAVNRRHGVFRDND